jgi:hypothetical protein
LWFALVDCTQLAAPLRASHCKGRIANGNQFFFAAQLVPPQLIEQPQVKLAQIQQQKIQWP